MQQREEKSVVWFKRDLRVVDHDVLLQASNRGALIPLLVIEPELWQQPDASHRQYAFMRECALELDRELERLGARLVVRIGRVVDVLADLKLRFGLTCLWSHEETGNAWTYRRDIDVAAWCRANGVTWHEQPQNGLVRRLKSRNGWAKRWDQQMAKPIAPEPSRIDPVGDIELRDLPAPESIGLSFDGCTERQRGGRRAALGLLDSFLSDRGLTYRRAMSSPLQGAECCSRLSPHLAWGSLSIREIAQATWARQRALRGNAGEDARAWRGSLASFSGRLHWHCHFMQKLETEPELETNELHPAARNLRPTPGNVALLEAWAQGRTGFPFVDACMRSLHATGWINFRMRAMLVSFASYNLWLPWQETGLVLARLFTDYEPGIHWPQMQMQSGTTGINTIRIYKPIKQGHDQDPDGVFVRRWVPELDEVPDAHVHVPWLWNGANDLVGNSPFWEGGLMTKRLIVVLGDQLTPRISSLRGADKERDVVLMCEVWEEATYVRHHKKKIAFIFSCMRHFATELREEGWTVDYRTLQQTGHSSSFTSEVRRAVERHEPQRIVVTMPGEWRVLQDMRGWPERFKVPVDILEDNRFVCSPAEFAKWADGRKQLRMEYFYREMRRKTGLLMEGDGPVGGQWNFDRENRKAAKPDLRMPRPLRFTPDTITQDVLNLVAERFSDHFGDLEPFWFGVTREQAEQALSHFVTTTLPPFGDYQDAMLEGEPFLYHSVLSIYMNVGLLDALDVCRRVEAAYRAGHVPLNAAEGYIRQVIGWREFVRGIYWLKMPDYVAENYFEQIRPVPEFYWTGETDMACLRAAIGQTKREAYAHHIQRLMLTGNFALLAGVSPQALHEWYLLVYADAFEWVELPNTLGMSQFGDGGVLASKPYVASGAYIKRMSNYCASCRYDVAKPYGPDACPFNALYWAFLNRHREKLAANPRMAQMYRTWDRLSDERRSLTLASAGAFLDKLDAEPSPGETAQAVDSADIADTIVSLCTERGRGKTICPSEVARALAKGDNEWRDLMPDVRRVAGTLAVQGRVRVTQAGKLVDAASARGPIRLSLAPQKKSRSRVS